MNKIQTFTGTDIWPPREFETPQGTLAIGTVTQGNEGASRDAIILGTDEKVRSALIILSTQNREDSEGKYLRHLSKAGNCTLNKDMNGLADLDKVQGELAYAEACDFDRARGTGIMINLAREKMNGGRRGQWANLLHNVAMICQSAESTWLVSNDFNYHGFEQQGRGAIEPSTPCIRESDLPKRVIALSTGMHYALSLRNDLKDTYLAARDELSPAIQEALYKLRNQPPATLATWLINHAQNALLLGPAYQRHPDHPYASHKPALSVGVWDIDPLTT